MEKLVRKIDGRVNEGYGKQFPIREDLVKFTRFINEELLKYFPEKMGRKKINMVIQEEIEELKTEREVKEKLYYLRGELEKVPLGGKDFFYFSDLIGRLEEKELFLEK